MNDFIITDAGNRLLSEMIAGDISAAFTRVETSERAYTASEAKKLTALAEVRQTVLVSNVRQTDSDTVEVIACVGNKGLESGYYVKAIGLYTKDSREQETLFGIAVNTDHPDFMEAEGTRQTVSETEYHLLVNISDTANINVTVNPSASVTAEQLQEVTADIEALKTDTEQEIKDMQKTLDGTAEKLENLFPDLTAPTETDAGKSLQITADGKAAWCKDSNASWQTLFPDMCLFGTTTFSDNNNHAEEVYTNGYRKTTDFNTDGSAIERLYDPDGTLLAAKKTVSNADGSMTSSPVE